MANLNITKRQKEFLRAIVDSLVSEGYPPTFDELKEKFGISSNQAIIDHLNALEKKKLIIREEGSARGIKITTLGYKSIKKTFLIPELGLSSAGPAIIAEEIIGNWQQISDEISQLDDNVFIIKIKGDSMINAGIQEGDQLLVKQEKEFRSGDIVLAQTPNGSTVKRFVSQDASPYLFLRPENPKYNIIYFTDEITLQGKVIGKFISGKIEQLIQGRFL